MRSTHSDQIERWLGADAVSQLSCAMRGWYGPAIAVAGVPGNVRVCADGDFVGTIKAGQEVSALERGFEMWRKSRRLARNRKQMGTLGSLDAIIAARAGGKGREFFFLKAGTTGVIAATNSLWRVGQLPAAGAAAGAAPGGTVPTDATTGAFPFTNPTNPDVQNFTTAWPMASAVNTLLLYDRLFAVAVNMNSTATQAITGVPTRYQSTTQGNADAIEGNFLFMECGTALAATAHNWTVCTYADQANAASTMPSMAGNASNIINRLDHPTSQWFAPLEAGDTGIKALTQIQLSAAVATGACDAVIGHPIAWMPCLIANAVCVVDGINSAFNLERVFDDACLAFLEVNKPATAATTYSGQFLTVAG
jgi:hypothetical protein